MDNNSTLLYQGKAKDIYQFEIESQTGKIESQTDEIKPNVVKMVFSDRITAGNGEKEDVIEQKGHYTCQISRLLFGCLEYCGIKTHINNLTQNDNSLNSNEMVVLDLKMIPLEVIVRNASTGSFSKRYGITSGKYLDHPVVEFCVKDDSLGDPFISEDSVAELGYATREVVKKLKYISLHINELLETIINGKYDDSYVDLIDFKLEFGFIRGDELCNVYLGDEISPDTMRIWKRSLDDFDVTSLDKDVYRKTPKELFRHEHLINVYQELYENIKSRVKVHSLELESKYCNVPIVILSGSKSDNHIVQKCTSVLDDSRVPYKEMVVSAHRDPKLLNKIIKQTKDYAKVYICVAGLSAALPGVVASKVSVPVVAVPVACPPFMGVDSLLSSVQMPPGVPVLTVGVDNGRNGAYAALKIVLS